MLADFLSKKYYNRHFEERVTPDPRSRAVKIEPQLIDRMQQ